MLKPRVALLFGLIALSLPSIATAQDVRRATVGVLIFSNPEPFLSVFRQGLRKLGYVEGKDHRLEIRSAGGDAELLARQSSELVRLKSDVIVAVPTPAALAAKRATRHIPIVMAGIGDPVGTGLVDSLARPGGNVTGVSSTNAETTGKLVEVLREILPSLKRVAVLANAADSFHKPFLEQVQGAGRVVALETLVYHIRKPGDLEAAFAEATRREAGAVISQPSLARKAVLDLALRHRLPVFASNEAFVDEGALASYSASLPALFLEAASYVDKILKGAKPSELPVQQPVKYVMVLNQRSARALGISIPPSAMVRADRVIE